MSHLAAGSSFSKHLDMKGEKSSWSYRPSLSRALVTPSSTAPTNTKLLAASICCDPAPLVHTPERDASYYPQYGTVVRGLPGDSGYDFPSALAVVVRFPISVTSSMEFRAVGNESRSALPWKPERGVAGWLSPPSGGTLAPMCITAQRRCAEALCGTSASNKGTRWVPRSTKSVL